VVAGMRMGSGRRPRAAAAAAAAAPGPRCCSHAACLPASAAAAAPVHDRTGPSGEEKRSRGGGGSAPARRMQRHWQGAGAGQGGCCTRRTPTTPAPPRVPPPAPCLPACPRLGQSLGDGPEVPPQSVSQSVSRGCGGRRAAGGEGGRGLLLAVAVPRVNLGPPPRPIGRAPQAGARPSHQPGVESSGTGKGPM
jgi:hypothetical protein